MFLGLRGEMVLRLIVLLELARILALETMTLLVQVKVCLLSTSCLSATHLPTAEHCRNLVLIWLVAQVLAERLDQSAS